MDVMFAQGTSVSTVKCFPGCCLEFTAPELLCWNSIDITLGKRAPGEQHISRRSLVSRGPEMTGGDGDRVREEGQRLARRTQINVEKETQL